MGITHKPMYHMYWTTDCILPMYLTGQQTVYYPSNGDINPCIICTGQQTVNIALLMGITHKPMYHMYWTTDCILPF